MWLETPWGPSSHNASSQVPPWESVVITHPIHPLIGLALPTVRLEQTLGRPGVIVRFPDGSARAIPLDWTDRHPVTPPLRLHERVLLLHPEALVQVRRLVDALLLKTASAAKLDASSQSRTVAAYHEHADAGSYLPSVVGSDPAQVPRRPRQPPAQGPGRPPTQ